LRWLVRWTVGEQVWPAARAALQEAGRLVPTQVEPLVRLGDAQPPRLRQYAPDGARIDTLELHPAYTDLEQIEHHFGLIRMSYLPGWRGLSSRAPRSLNAALLYLFGQADQSLCGGPLLATDATCWALERHDHALAGRFVPRLASDGGDFLSAALFFSDRTSAGEAAGDETRATRLDDGSWRLSGNKWFGSNPDADLVLVRARVEGSDDPGLFLMPRWLEDGRRNHYLLNRLKDKFGTRLTAAAEIRLEGAVAWPVGSPERGQEPLRECIMVTRTLIPALAAAVMRRVAQEAIAHARRRTLSGGRLEAYPLLADSLAELVVDATAGLTGALALTDLFDRWHRQEAGSATLLSLLAPLLKLHIAERARAAAAVGMELRGGDGYVLDWPEGRLLRDVTAHTLWDAPPNRLALEITEAAERAASDFNSELDERLGQVDGGITRPLARPLRRQVEQLREGLARLPDLEPTVRQLRAGRLARRAATLVTAIHLAQQARLFAGETGSSRLAWLTARYAARLGGGEATDEVANHPGWLPHAAALLQGGPVPLEIGEQAIEATAQALSI
jgi:acyl-CoA dehydrogenase